jgi:glyoxylase-like metal-dependent hydrolase (beta-lactamase superfamily II)
MPVYAPVNASTHSPARKGARGKGDHSHMLTWSIGAVKIAAVVEMEMTLEPGLLLKDVTPEMLRAISWLSPDFIDAEGGLYISYQAFLVDALGLKLVVDTCIGNDNPRGFPPHNRLSTPLLRQMGEAGFTRDNVDVVICTHMHYDHVGWNTMLENGRWVATFPKARYLFARTEYGHWKKKTGSALSVMSQEQVLADSVQPILDTGLAILVGSDHRIGNEIRLMPTPGHTPGHVSVLIESERRTAIITGDMIHHPCQVAHPEWVSSADEEPALVRATRQRMIEGCADAATLVIGTHFIAPTAGHVRHDGKSYRFYASPRNDTGP